MTAKVDTANIVTILSSSSTDTQIPSAKTVFDAIESVSAGVPADVYSKTDVDNLLANKADTSAIIDAYSKTEVDGLMNAKANANDVYAKTDVDNLLSAKADSADIIDAYTKDEVDDLLADKADSSSLIDAYTKEEVNNLLDDKVNTDDLVDAYSKEEVDNLLNNKADSSAIVDSYSKTEVDTLLTGKADSSSIIDSYTKDEVDDLLDSKADSSSIVDAYTKGEVDGLLADKVNISSVVTELSSSSTDEEIPSAKAVYTYVDNKEVKISAEEDNKIEIKDDGIFVSKDYVEITQDEYDLLTEEEKEDIVFYITDASGNSELVTVIDENSTDEQVPSAKAVYTAIQNVSTGIPADVYSKTDVDDLLANKADTSAIIDAYTKTEVDGLLADKANVDDIVDSYTKTETDGLLTAKADTTALDGKLDKTAIVTSISSTSTDEEIPSAKAVYNELDTLNGKVTTNTTNIATNTTRIYGIPKRNILINGEFQVNKHKTSVPEGNVTTRYVIDRWATTHSGLSISGNTIDTTAEQEQINSGYKLRVQVRSSNYSGISVYQIIENAKILYTGKTLTMSFWIKGNRAEGKTVIARIGSGGGNTGETTVTLTDSWQYVTTTRKDCYFGGRSDGGVVILSYDTFGFGSGFDIACVKLELGDTATPFEHIPYAEELLMCQRYYMKIEGVNSNSELGLGHFSAIPGTTVYPIVCLPTPMRNEPYRAISPTLVSGVSGLELYGCNSSRTAYEVRPVTNLSIYAIQHNLVTFKCETDGEFALGTSGDFRFKRNGSQYTLELDAELY